MIGGVRTWLDWGSLSEGASPEFSLGILIFTFTIMVALILLISRGRSRIAMWTLIVLHIAGLALLIGAPSDRSSYGGNLLGLLQTAAQTLAIALLFLPSSRAWMAREQPETSKANEL